MPIIPSKEDDRSMAALDVGLRILNNIPEELAVDSTEHTGTRGLKAETHQSFRHTVTHPHKVFTMTLTDLATGQGLANAQLVGWRYLINEGDAATKSIEVYTDEDEETYEFAGLNEGPFNQSTLTTLDALKNHRKVQLYSYEWSVLRIPALFVFALWFRSDNKKRQDLLVPIEPTHHALEAGRVYYSKEFSQKLMAAAQEAIAADEQLAP